LNNKQGHKKIPAPVFGSTGGFSTTIKAKKGTTTRQYERPIKKAARHAYFLGSVDSS